jgi:GNAT superfamily N-acetyltransferase
MQTFAQFTEAAKADRLPKVLSHFGYSRQGDAWTHPKTGSTVTTSDKGWTHQHAGKSKKGTSANGLETHLTAAHQQTMFDVPNTAMDHKPRTKKAPEPPSVHNPHNNHDHQYSLFGEETEDPQHFTSAEHLRNHFTAKHPGTSVDFYDNNNHKHSSLGMISVPKEHQKKGIGSHIMKAITKYADHHGRTVSLSPEKRPGGPSKSKLEDWYKTHGFVHNKGRHKDYRFSDTMIRTPKG